MGCPKISKEYRDKTCSLCGQPFDKSIQIKRLKQFIVDLLQKERDKTIRVMITPRGDAYDKKIIEETLRAVLPNISLGVPTSQYGFGYNDAIKEIKNKAKKLYNLDL